MTRPETPTISDLIQTGIEGRLSYLHTALPAKVKSFDSATNTVAVQPCIRRKFFVEGEQTETVDLPVIEDVPVLFPRAGKAFIYLPLKAGDYVLLIFSERSIEKWKNKGGVVSADDPRKFDLSDAFALPGGYPVTEPIFAEEGALVVKNESAKLTMKPSGDTEIKAGVGLFTLTKDGKLTIGTSAVDVVSVLDGLIDEILKITVPTGVGPSGTPLNAAALAKLKAKLSAIKA